MKLMKIFKQMFTKILSTIIDVWNGILLHYLHVMNKTLGILCNISIWISCFTIVKSIISRLNKFYMLKTRILLLKWIQILVYYNMASVSIIIMIFSILYYVFKPQNMINICQSQFIDDFNRARDCKGQLVLLRSEEQQKEIRAQISKYLKNMNEYATEALNYADQARKYMKIIGIASWSIMHQGIFGNISIPIWDWSLSAILSFILPCILIIGCCAISKWLERYNMMHSTTFDIMGWLILLYSYFLAKVVRNLPTINVVSILKNFYACCMLILLLVSCCLSIVILAVGCKLNLMGQIVKLSGHNNPFWPDIQSIIGQLPPLIKPLADNEENQRMITLDPNVPFRVLLPIDPTKSVPIEEQIQIAIFQSEDKVNELPDCCSMCKRRAICAEPPLPPLEHDIPD